MKSLFGTQSGEGVLMEGGEKSKATKSRGGEGKRVPGA